MNPYQSPREFEAQRSEKKPTTLSPVTWAIFDFLVGTLLLAPLVLSTAIRVQLASGASLGGTIGVLFGWAHGLARRRKVEEKA